MRYQGDQPTRSSITQTIHLGRNPSFEEIRMAFCHIPEEERTIINLTKLIRNSDSISDDAIFIIVTTLYENEVLNLKKETRALNTAREWLIRKMTASQTSRADFFTKLQNWTPKTTEDTQPVIKTAQKGFWYRILNRLRNLL